jgi:hypothetical protein
MDSHDLPTEGRDVAVLTEEVGADDIQDELAAGGREACSVGFGFTPDVRLAFSAVRPRRRVHTG